MPDPQAPIAKVPVSEKQPPVVILSGPVPDAPELFCATCAMIYMGKLSGDEAVQKEVQAKAEKAYEDGKTLVTFNLEYLIGLIDQAKLRLFLHHAVTIAPSTHFDEPMPVCWTHIKGWRPISGKLPFPSGLIAGKAHTIPRPAGSG